jgi:tetratricopeptide (TPR) repeat protein
MKNNHENKVIPTDDTWLAQENPEIYYVLRGVQGDAEALRWLEHKGDGLFLFTLAVRGDRHAVERLHSNEPLELDDLFDTVCHYDLGHYLADHAPDLHLLLESIRGDDTALRRLQRRKRFLGKLAETVRELYRNYQCEDDGSPDGEEGAGVAGITEGAAADVGCLIGELHLNNGEYEKAVEAFTRSLEGTPTADAYEGRARAYHGLAEADERRALELRAKMHGSPSATTHP